MRTLGATLATDVKFAFRLFWKNRAFTLLAVSALALGIGANTAIFTVVDGVLLRPLGFREPERLVMIWEHNIGRDRPFNVVAPANYLDWKNEAKSFESWSLLQGMTMNLTGYGDPEELAVDLVEPGYFEVLGVQPKLGRTFRAEEAGIREARAVVLSHGLWQRRFGGDPSIIGRSITMDSQPVNVVGVMPANLPAIGRQPQFWTAFQLDPARNYRQRAGRYLRVVARLKPGVPAAQAQAELKGIAARLEQRYPEFNKNWSVNVVPLQENMTRGVRTALLVFLGAVGFVLLIACANVANLLLSRAAARRREMAVRLSLGAVRGRLIRQLLTESVLLALAGAALGVVLAYLGVEALRLAKPQGLPRLDEIALDGRVLLYTGLLAVVTGIVFGLSPALAAGRVNLNDTLKEGGRPGGSLSGGGRLRNAFVVVQVALSLVLLTGAGLMIRSFSKLLAVEPGFQPHGLLTMQLNLPRDPKFREANGQVQFYNALFDRIRRVPGVSSASGITWLPLTGPGAATSFSVVGRPEPAAGEFPVTEARPVMPGYFETLGIPLLRGRWMTEADNRPEAPRRFVVTEALVRQIFPNEDPIGKQLKVRMGDDKPGEIIGVVGDIKYNGPDGEVRATVYYPVAHLAVGFLSLVVRTQSDPMLLAPAITRAIRDVAPNQPVSEVRAADELLARSVAQPRFRTALLSIFAFIALVLAAVGVYGVMSYAVAQRTGEIGVRMALGAREGDVLRMVVAGGMKLALGGLLAGTVAALALTRWLKTLLFEVEATDPLTFASVAGTMALVAALACYLPARRAARLDPTVALRYE
ncbi:MAG: ABC transporter permease [Bryobacteraceae bacterium]|nr:ABC transporter permease [Bryobacteraceae bacterium]